ncbi:MAG: histidine--tRNA ligase [Lachnospiraceae bacterium]|nr:histidine--tRNA ligase [Lachnospiraceae bacterium]
MALIKKPVTGMRDILPAEMALRQYCLRVIRETYGRFGFTEIETPVAESLENLNSKQGGENEKLIFRVLKRGEKLDLSNAKTADDVSDMGLRYDLTVPLVRYYAAHANELASPFKALQTGSVFRADRPQKGRYRQFTQCDIDIFGEKSTLAEIELILATTAAIGKLSFHDFCIRISDRRLLKAMAAFCGFPEERQDSVFITLDKLDKIGPDGVRKELTENGFAQEAVEKCLSLFHTGEERGKDAEAQIAAIESFCAAVGGPETEAVCRDLTMILNTVEQTKEADFRMIFDPTLVRGMGYYTGTIFEISLPQFGASCGGGGRYDKLVGLFTGQETPACGFSIGFERIVMILLEEGFRIPGEEEKTAFLIEKGVAPERMAEILTDAKTARDGGQTVLVCGMNKNKKFQKEQLSAQGYTAFREFFRE